MADRHLIDVHVLLRRENELLLTQRRSGLFDAQWHLPSGKVDAGESLTSAAAREVAEEVGVTIDVADLRFVHMTHVADSGPEPRVGVFFIATSWRGLPTNREPDKCSAVEFFPIDQLPAELIAYPAQGINAALRGAGMFSELGWRTPAIH